MATSEKPSCLRFADVGPSPKSTFTAIEGYEDTPLVTLEEAVKPLVSIVPKIENYVVSVKRHCQEPKDGLTIDESASIMLYTNDSFETILNEALCSGKRQQLKPWFSYLRIILSALGKLPSRACHVLQEVYEDLSESYIENQTIVWYQFTTYSSSIARLKQNRFFSRKESRTLLHIDCLNGKDITNHSLRKIPNEILLLPARQFRVESILKSHHGINNIFLVETEPEIPLIDLPPVVTSTTSKPRKRSKIPQIPSNSTWSQNATTIITGLSNPLGLAVDQDNGTVYVADWKNKRIISWNPNTNETNVILSNLGGPTDVLIDKETNSIIIADCGNKRVLRCSLENGKNQVETIIDNIGCSGLTMDNEGSLYVCDWDKHEVRKFPRGEKTGILVAGGNGQGNGNHQLSDPHYIALDDEGSLYVSDCWNHRVMKWKKEAKEGITVAGGNGRGSNNNQLSFPEGIVVDSNGNIYVAEGGNDRVTRWRKGEKTGEVLVGGYGNEMNQFYRPIGLSFDRQNNLYVVDCRNNRVQRFSLK